LEKPRDEASPDGERSIGTRSLVGLLAQFFSQQDQGGLASYCHQSGWQVAIACYGAVPSVLASSCQAFPGKRTAPTPGTCVCRCQIPYTLFQSSAPTAQDRLHTEKSRVAGRTRFPTIRPQGCSYWLCPTGIGAGRGRHGKSQSRGIWTATGPFS
jgi:hypothetical protein